MKPAKNLWGPKFWSDRLNSGPKLVFLSFSQVWFICFPENCIDNNLEHCLTTSRCKNHEKSFGAPSQVQNQGFCYFLKVASLVFLDVAQDCSLEQCLTSSRAETSQKYFVSQIGTKMIFPILILLSVHSNLLVLFHLFNQ